MSYYASHSIPDVSYSNAPYDELEWDDVCEIQFFADCTSQNEVYSYLDDAIDFVKSYLAECPEYEEEGWKEPIYKEYLLDGDRLGDLEVVAVVFYNNGEICVSEKPEDFKDI